LAAAAVLQLTTAALALALAACALPRDPRQLEQRRLARQQQRQAGQRQQPAAVQQRGTRSEPPAARPRNGTARRTASTRSVVVVDSTRNYRVAARTLTEAADTILEVGSSYGVTSELMARRCRGVIGVDKGQREVEEARRRYGPAEHPSLRFVQCDAGDTEQLLAASAEMGWAGRYPFTKLFVDVSGTAPLKFLVPLLEALQETWRPALMVVKSTRLARLQCQLANGMALHTAAVALPVPAVKASQSVGAQAVLAALEAAGLDYRRLEAVAHTSAGKALSSCPRKRARCCLPSLHGAMPLLSCVQLVAETAHGSFPVLFLAAVADPPQLEQTRSELAAAGVECASLRRARAAEVGSLLGRKHKRHAMAGYPVRP